MKQNKILFLLCTFLLLFLSCKKKQIKSVTNLEKETLDSIYICLQDSITVPFLSKTNYKKAIKTCNLTISNNEFVLGEYGLMGPSRILKKHFSKIEISNQNIVIKHVFWETKDGEHFIQVWYQQKDNIWLPIEAYKHNKSTQF